ncbi:hypothetical protein HDU67_002193 [Dinochytrium kinnereticum]|nr:hypothetical protein HDU67_002193 [Dinochytrium kinnereticum]
MKIKKKERKGPPPAAAAAVLPADAAANGGGGTLRASNDSNEMTSFPRGHGGASDEGRLTALEVREINDRVSREVAMEKMFSEDKDEDMTEDGAAKKRKRQVPFDVQAKRLARHATTETNDRPNKKPKRGKQSGSEIGTDEKGDSGAREGTLISNITFKRLSVGMKFLGVIREVNDLDAVVALPNQLAGFLSITEISAKITSMVELAASGEGDSTDDIPSLSNLLAVGQIIPCTIVALEDAAAKGGEDESVKRRVELSIRPSFTNAGVKKSEIVVGMSLVGSVVSVEDHGYLLDVGIEGVQGFLHKKKSAAYRARFCSGNDFAIGQPVPCCILEMKENARVLTLSAEPDAFAKTSIAKDVVLPFGGLMPGNLVQGRVKSIKDNGITVSFMELFDGSITLPHLNVFDSEELKKNFKVGQTITSRVLYVDPEQKTVHLTRRKALLDWTSEPMSVNFGHTWDSVEIVRVEEKLGLFVKCPNGAFGHIHISRISDTRLSSVDDEKYLVGSHHKARVTGFDWNDGLLLLSMKPSVLNSPFLRKEDIETGTVVKGTISKVENYGIHVALSEHINALVPQSHLSEMKVINPSKIFKVGAPVKCRVLANNLTTKKITLTLKKNLINSELPPIASYDLANIGVITNGYIVSVKDFGCIVGFYNDVRAIAPLPELSDRFVRHASELFTVGEVVKCRVTFVDPDAQRMTVSMKIFNSAENNVKDLEIGETVSGKVLSILPDSALLELYPSLARGHLPKAHLSDHNEHSDLMLSSLKEGTEIQELIIIDKDLKRGRAVVSAKPMLVQSAKDMKEVGSLEVGDVVAGHVKSFTDSKLFVGFVNGKTGVAKINGISDSYVSKVSELFLLGQTVQCRILSWSDVQSQYEISLKQSQLTDSNTTRPTDVPFLSSLFKERDQAAESTAENLKETRAWTQKYAIGSSVNGTVRQKTPYGLIIDLENGDATGLVTSELAGSVSAKENGKAVVGRVLDADIGKRILDLKVIEGGESVKVSPKVVKQLEPLLKADDKIDAIVEVVKTSYLIVSLPAFSSIIAYAATKTYNNAAISSSLKLFRVGQKLKVSISHVPAVGEKHTKKSDRYAAQRVFVTIAPTATPSETSAKKDADGKRIIKDSVDPTVSCLEDLTIGRLIKGRVKTIMPNQINVIIGSNLRGRVHITEIANSIKEIEDRAHPFKKYKVGAMLSFKVVGFHENGKTHKFLPITHRNPTAKTIVELSLRPKDLAVPSGELVEDPKSRHLTLDTIETGIEYLGYVSKTSGDAVWVCLSPFLLGRAHILECSDEMETLKDLTTNFPPGHAVTCKVLTKNLDKSELNLSLRPTPQHTLLEDVKASQKLIGKVTKVDPKRGITVQISDNLYGRVSFADVPESIKDPVKDLETGMLVSCFAVGKQAESGNIMLVIGEKPPPEKKEVKEGDIVSGIVKNIAEGGLFVDLGRGLTGRVRIKDLSDQYVKEWKGLYEIGAKVKGKILSVALESSRLELSLKESDVNPGAVSKAKSTISVDSLSAGMKIKGTVKAIEPYGVFIRLDGSNISGLCHKSEISDIPFTSIASLYEIGDPVKAVILNVDKKKNKVSFGLKASYFEEEDASGDEDVDMRDAKLSNSTVMDIDSDDEDSGNIDDDNGIDEDEDEDGIADIDDEEDEIATKSTQDALTGAPIDYMRDMEPLDIDAESDDDGSDDDDAMDEDNTPETEAKGKSRRQKKREKETAEEKVRQQEEALLEDSAPDSADAFERLLLGSPNSSFLWIKFMAYFVQISDIPKARDVAERALKGISFREQTELLNIWVALLNLENSYGDRDSLQKVFNRAVAYNEAKAVFMHMANIYERTGKFEDLDQLFQAMIKRFKESCKVWIAYGLSLMKRKKLSDARAVLSKSLKSLAKRKHLKAICKFAQMEFKMGEPERGRTLFEGIISNHPKRLDMWSIYLDMEIKNGDVAITRRLFDRAITLKLSSKKMKFLFKKYLDFEKSFGTESGVEGVKNKAMQYVESISSA